MIVDYYVRERLEPQLAYATQRARSNASLERSTLLVGPSFFLFSVLAAFGHFTYEAMNELRDKPEAIGLILIFLAAALPAVGAGVRILRALPNLPETIPGSTVLQRVYRTFPNGFGRVLIRA